jgi:hypothetical protein
VSVLCFLLFLCFRKATQKIFSELNETKAKPSIFIEASRSPKMRRRGARSQPHPRVAWPKILVPELKKFPRGLGIPGYHGNREIPTVYRANSKTEFQIQIFSKAVNKRVSKRFAVVSL